MKHLLPGLIGLILISSCKKNSGEAVSPINDATTARAIFNAIDVLWQRTLSPALSKNSQTFTNTVLQDSSGGSATVNGTFSTTTTSYPNSSSSTYNMSVIINFDHYRSNGLELNGPLRFYDARSSRTDCGSSGCASTSHNSTAYDDKDQAGGTLPAITVSLKYNGRQYEDNILLVASKEYSSWSVKIITAAQKTLSF
ncbi:MAG: hypothetical protein JST42_18425 [Bacteroidetes bacterium]|nr:hypothetical protein [Bacteroidota bacterium]